MKTNSILIVEDDLTFATMLKTWLGKKGFTVDTASNNARARKLIEAQTYNLILSDLRLPDQDGIFLLNWMRDKNIETPLIIMTSYADIQSVVHAIKQGASDYISKPIQPDELLKKIKEALAGGLLDVVVGTHALISDSVTFFRLGLVITDEQHRFGVEQRAALVRKGEQPHTLVMSATPIPRTLALLVYGDLDVSIIDELPPGRQPVQTVCVDERYRARLNAFIDKLIGEGRQVFVVCPKVEETDDVPSDLKSAEEHAQALQRTFPQHRVACIHGRMKARDKDACMAAFAAGETDILVSTTVIEVGVDVPNAALMIIENAERFGLSQLHQLRGRIGRGPFQSYCVLVSDAHTEEARARLKVLCDTADGFQIAEADLRQRGPGDFFGNRQHGLPALHIADLGTNMTAVNDARDAARAVLAADPALSAPEHAALRAQCARLFAANDGHFN